jgi:ribonuclease Z
MNINGRKKKLHIWSPSGLEEMIDKIFDVSGSHIDFEIVFHIINTEKTEKIFDDSHVEIQSFPLDHRVPACGFKFTEKGRLRNIDSSMISTYNLNINQIKAAKFGYDIEFPDGTVIKNKDVTLPPKKLRSYAYCSDTKYNDSIANYVRNVDLLYHESTYLDHLKDKAGERFHSTASDAALIAKKANAGKLLLGHFSSRYGDLSGFISEAKQHFENVELGRDGYKFSVKLNHDENEF